MNKKNVGTIIFHNAAQLALFTNELDGQISDGMWENTRPDGHYIFWHSLDHAIGENVGVKTNEHYSHYGRERCMKNNYNFMSSELLDCVGDRMLKAGRLAQCISTDDITVFKKKVHASDYMPDTLEQYEAFFATGAGVPEYATRYVNELSLEEGRKFYTVVYTVKDLHKDLRAIKKICKTAPVDR